MLTVRHKNRLSAEELLKDQCFNNFHIQIQNKQSIQYYKKIINEYSSERSPSKKSDNS